MRPSDTAFALAAGIVLLTVACQGAGVTRKVPSDSTSVAAASATDASIDSVDAELDSLVRFGPAHMETIISRHTLTTSNMLAGMAADLQRAGVAGDAAWTARVDSVRQDLTRMSKLSERELMPFLQDHTQLIHRLTQQYHTLMSKAPPPARSRLSVGTGRQASGAGDARRGQTDSRDGRIDASGSMTSMGDPFTEWGT